MKRLLIPIGLALVSVACSGGGSGGSSNANAPQGNNPSAPTVSFSASPSTVTSGGSSTLSWSATNASSCSASGAWSGTVGTTGSFQTGALNADATFTLNCTGAGGGVMSRVTVTVAQSTNNPTVQLSASPPGVSASGSTTLTWTSSNVTSCTASGGTGFTGNVATGGSVTVGPLTQDQTYQINCSGANGNAMAMTTVMIRRAILTWTAPSQNVDGSPLTDLAGYKVYWGTQSRNYGTPAVVNGAGTTTYTVNLGPGTYFFALSAFNSSGDESAKTNEVSKTIL